MLNEIFKSINNCLAISASLDCRSAIASNKSSRCFFLINCPMFGYNRINIDPKLLSIRSTSISISIDCLVASLVIKSLRIEIVDTLSDVIVIIPCPQLQINIDLVIVDI
ncbi:hypothetical protein DERP_003371 [Dermatophagoides pteronyssinus]|uniref:Uncharacterized protein n=1 Tax=Dermatophagoides pteronyssinus TaxID=6956 RepID=A0ABQ8JJB7_DERPT|nr:hypothetical protein DERP_003371 [Dermatophagoides pteronyssinus]